jgi:hypothetical protein
MILASFKITYLFKKISLEDQSGNFFESTNLWNTSHDPKNTFRKPPMLLTFWQNFPCVLFSQTMQAEM